MLRLLAKLRSR